MSAPDITEHDRDAVLRVLESGRLSMGAQTELLEKHASARARVRHGVAMSSGTAGLHVAVRALDIARGDVVVTPSFSFAASTNCFLYEGAVPAFADIDPVSLNVEPDHVRIAILQRRRAGERVRAILPVHVFGQPCDMDPIRDIAREEELPIIEDSCEAIGAEYKGRAAGGLGDVGVFAFYPNKQMTTGEGGVLVTSSDRIAEWARSLRNQGRGEGGAWLEHVRLGYNYRLDEMSAALGVAQIERLDELVEARASVAAAYGRALTGIAGVVTPTIVETTTRMSWFVYVIRLERGVDRGRVVAALAERGVETRPYFLPIHTQPYIRSMFGDLAGTLPVTEDLGRRTLALPFHARLSDDGVAYVADALRHAVNVA